MTEVPSKADRLAHNAVLTLVARGLMIVGGAAAVPAVAGILDMRLEVKIMRGEIATKVDQVEQRLTARIAQVEGRQSESARRADLTDTRIERLTDISGKFSVDVAVLTEQIRALLSANQSMPPRPGQR